MKVKYGNVDANAEKGDGQENYVWGYEDTYAC
jgi:hypothetical protein